ncbi:hypothetical protein [Aeromonas dhakensis]|uniref:hypothetical protein n=1 Tax=Aeromonas dhakensis TaxID=196024 RepID=UPI003B9F015B
MEDDLLNKIADDLHKSGFSSEMRVLKTFSDKGWETSGIASYFDKDDEKTRESDLLAYHYIGQDVGESIDASSYFQIVGEVKKSNKPWVIFKETPEDSWELEEGFSGLVFHDGIHRGKKRVSSYSKFLRKSGIGYQSGWVGRGIHESFKNPDQPSRWYPALIGVAKAGEHELEANSWDKNKERDKPHPPYMFFVKPIVVIDGLLVAACLDDNANISVEHIPYATVKFEFKTKSYNRKHYMIDVIQINHLEQYIDFCKSRHEILFEKMLESAGFILANRPDHL